MLLYLSLLLVILLYLWVKKCYNYWTKYNVPTPPVTFPFGHLSGFGYKIHSSEGFDRFYKEYKNKYPAIGMYFYFGPTMLLLDTEVIKDVLVKDFSSFHDRGFYYNKESDPLSANMVKKNL
jgi:cytochrome P450 family 6